MVRRQTLGGGLSARTPPLRPRRGRLPAAADRAEVDFLVLNLDDAFRRGIAPEPVEGEPPSPLARDGAAATATAARLPLYKASRNGPRSVTAISCLVISLAISQFSALPHPGFTLPSRSYGSRAR